MLAAGLLLAALLGGVVSESRSAGPAPVDQTQSAALRSEFGSADTVSLVRRLQDQARARPEDAQTNALLGLAYAQRARETGDAAFYSRADAVLHRAHELDAGNLYALTGLGGIGSPTRFGSDARRRRRRPDPRRRTASSATRSSSSAGTARRSRRSTAWLR